MVHVHDLEAPAFPFGYIGGVRHAAEQQHQHAAERVVAAVVFLRHPLQFKPVFQFRHGDQAVEQPRAVLALHRPGVFRAGGLELAGNGLEQVLRRDQPLHLAVLVDHQRHVR